MIDFWEAIGRLACDPTLSEKFIAQFPSGYRVEQATSPEAGLKIPGEKYREIQDFFAPILSEGILSIMAAGELYSAFSVKDMPDRLRSLQTFTKSKNVTGSSTGFFIALGMILVDRHVREKINTGFPISNARPNMSAIELSTITDLATDSEFGGQAAAMGNWDGPACKTHALYWPGYIQPPGSSKNDKGNSAAA